MFAKLYDTKYGQILVKADMDSDGNPEIATYFNPPELGVCCSSFKFKDTEEGWDNQKECFEQITEDSATDHVGKLMQELGLAAFAEDCVTLSTSESATLN